MFKAAMFDLDGTLTNTLQDIGDAMNHALRLYKLPEWPIDAYRYLVGNGAKKLAERAVRDRQDLMPGVLREYQAYYETHTRVTTRPYDGIPELLHMLQQRGVKLSVLSNKPDADTKNVVAYFFPDVKWQVVRGQVEGVPVKPDPAGAIIAAGELGVAPEDILYLGDTAVDMETAVNAGMYPVGALWGFRDAQELEQSGAKHLAESPKELIKWLQNVTNL